MARYVCEAGEVELLREVAEGDRGGVRLQGFVVVTNHRVVLLVPKKVSSLGWLRWLGGPFLARMAQDVAPLEMTHAIELDDFAEVHGDEHGRLSFHSKGEGYAHISFAVHSMTPFKIWQQRMHRWVARTLSPAQSSAAEPADR
jgi:hypothetical protein